MRGLSLVAASGDHSSSRCAGLSLSRPLLLRSTGSRRAGSVVVAHGPSCSAACGIFPDQGSNTCALHWQADSQPLRHQGSPLLLSFKNSLCILDNRPLSDVSFANSFSQSVACLLILLTLSFVEQKFLILMKSSLSIISFMDCAFGVIFKKLLLCPRLSRFSPVLSSRSFKSFTFYYTNQFSLQSKGAVTVEDYWTECQYYDIV